MSICLFYCLSTNLYAVPNIISYQGKLNNQNGQPLTGAYSITFTIYDAATGGTALWVETWTGPHSVNVKDGLFNVELGAIQPLSPTIFDRDDLFLGIKVVADSEMLPRQRFTSGVYAYRAALKTPLQIIFYTGDPISISVPADETWEIWGASIHAKEDWGYASLGDIKVIIDSVEAFVSTKDYQQLIIPEGSLDNNDYRYLKTITGFFGQPLEAKPGQSVTIQAILFGNSPHVFKIIGGGLYYYKKNL